MTLVRNEVLNLMGITMASIWSCEHYSFIRSREVILLVPKAVCFLDKGKKKQQIMRCVVLGIVYSLR